MPVKLPNKKPAGPKPAKEKVVKPKKEAVKPGKPLKPDPTARTKVVGNQPGVVRGITYYKAAKSDEDEHRGGESSTSNLCTPEGDPAGSGACEQGSEASLLTRAATASNPILRLDGPPVLPTP